MTVTQRISDESLFRGSIKKRHNNIRLKNKNKKKTRREQTRNKVQHWRWSIIDYTIRDSTHSLTTSSHWTQHGASDCCRFVIVRLFFFLSMCVSRSVCSIEEEDHDHSSQSGSSFFLVIPSVRIQTLPEHLTRTWTIERPWKEDFYFSLYKNPNPPSSSTWGLGPSNSF